MSDPDTYKNSLGKPVKADISAGDVSEGTPMSRSFLEQQGSLKLFISKFIQRPQDVDDIAQETFIRAIRAETRNDIEFP